PGQQWNPPARWGAADDAWIGRAAFRAERVQDRTDGVPSALDSARHRGPGPIGPAAAVHKVAADGQAAEGHRRCGRRRDHGPPGRFCFVAALTAGTEVTHRFGSDRAGYLYLIEGTIVAGGDDLSTGD